MSDHDTHTTHDTVRDRFQLARVNTLVNLHGSVHWFEKHGFVSMEKKLSNTVVHYQGSSPLVVFGFCLLTACVCVGAFLVMYRSFLRPRIVKRFLSKQD